MGELRPQPRRAHPGQAQRDRAAGGVRRVRSGTGDAGVRTRPDPPAAADARRRSAPDPDGLQPAVRPARHPGAVLRRGDRDGREPRPPAAGWPCGRRCSGATAKNGGFSNARPSRLVGPVVEGAYGPEFVNVVDQLNDPDSLLNFIQRLTRCYRDCPELGWGEHEILDQPHRGVLALRSTWDDGSIVTAAQPGRRSGRGAADRRRDPGRLGPHRPARRRPRRTRSARSLRGSAGRVRLRLAADHRARIASPRVASPRVRNGLHRRVPQGDRHAATS